MRSSQANRFGFGFVRASALLALVFSNAALAQMPTEDQLSGAPIPREALVQARVGVRTDQGNYAVLTVGGGDTLFVDRLELWSASGRRLMEKVDIRLEPTMCLDVDTGTVGRGGEDVWWQTPDGRSFNLTPINGASIGVLSPVQNDPSRRPDPVRPKCPVNPFANLQFSTDPIERDSLRDARLVVRTDRGNYAVLDVLAGDDLQIEHVEVLDARGKRILEASDLELECSFSMDLDRGVVSRKGADIRWQADNRGHGLLDVLSGAEMALLR